MIVKLLPYLGGLSLIAILLVVSIPCLKKMISVPQIIKEHADALIGAVVIFILILPFTLWKSGYYGKDKLFDNSDTLGYYGALIGGGVTVLGVYWTLNYESKKSKDEKRESSLPIFTFSIHSNTENSSNDCNDIEPFVIGENLKDIFKDEDDKLNKRCNELINRRIKVKKRVEEFEDYEVSEKIRTDLDEKEMEKNLEYLRGTIESSLNNLDKEIRRIIDKRKICRLDKSIILNINNIGLQSAILSTIKFIPKGIISSSDESKKRILDYLSVQKGEDTKLKVIFDCYFENQDGLNSKFQEWGDLELKYTDLYSNQYKYDIPIKIKRGTVQEEDKIPIEQFDLIIDKSQLPIRPKVN
ncbi:hypothetical protein [Streptococcus salivarius]|uniref:hypothetical protein n=1 Tax=Streptococcus salivarius TaxID=1304 RepID=UPI0015C553EB|nr:hypothetical protein [Streptococcus salivarius]